MPKRSTEHPTLISDVQLSTQTPRKVLAEIKGILDEQARLKPAGKAKENPQALLQRFKPHQKVGLFGATFWLSQMNHDEYLNFLVAYVGIPNQRGRIRHIYPRIFYKDSSLVWRVASHFISEEDEHWIGKGDVRWEQRADGEYLSSAEETRTFPTSCRAHWTKRVERASHALMTRPWS